MIHKPRRKYYRKNHCICGDHFNRHYFEELSEGMVLVCDVCRADCRDTESALRAAKFMEKHE